MKKWMGRVSAVALMCAGFACGSSDEDASQSQPKASKVLSSAVTKVVLEVDYAPGAEPYTGAAGRMQDVWKITEENVARLFEKAPKTVVVPHTLAEMQSLSDVTQAEFTGSSLLDIASKHREVKSEGTTASYYVLFVNGYYNDGNGKREDVLGIALGDSGVVAMFKPVIAKTESATPGVARFVEQSTFVHELGHSLGLVNRGLAMAAGHEDAEHSHHCSNDKCVMYWANEGASSVVAFAKKLLLQNSFVLFDDACLADADAAASK